MPTYYFTDKPGVDHLYCADVIRADSTLVVSGEDLLKIMIERSDGTQVYGNIQTTTVIPPAQQALPDVDANQA